MGENLDEVCTWYTAYLEEMEKGSDPKNLSYYLFLGCKECKGIKEQKCLLYITPKTLEDNLK